MRIVLASTSPYRRELLARLQLPFTIEAPHVHEAALHGELPADTARRLAEAKARAVARRHPDALVIGSDQVCAMGSTVLGKPGDHGRALAQLVALQGRTAVFHTALAVVSPQGHGIDCVDTTVHFRKLGRAQLDAYLALDRAYDCAGAAKIESLGIALVESVDSPDPTALVGLPLIALTSRLLEHGIDVLGAARR